MSYHNRKSIEQSGLVAEICGWAILFMTFGAMVFDAFKGAIQ